MQAVVCRAVAVVMSPLPAEGSAWQGGRQPCDPASAADMWEPAACSWERMCIKNTDSDMLSTSSVALHEWCTEDILLEQLCLTGVRQCVEAWLSTLTLCTCCRAPWIARTLRSWPRRTCSSSSLRTSGHAAYICDLHTCCCQARPG